MAELIGLNGRQQKELLKLRARLAFRQFMGEKGRILTAVMTIAGLSPLMIGLAIATGAGYLFLPQPWPAQLLGFVLLLSWLVWSMAPLFSFSVNEGLDPTRLLVYPISRRDFLAYLLLSTLLDYPTYFVLPFFIAIVVAFGPGLSLPIVLAAIFLCYSLMVLTGQTLISTVGGILRSRRFRDISMVVGAFLGFSCWFIFTSLQGLSETLFDTDAAAIQRFLQVWQPLEFMKWLPPGAAAKAIVEANEAAWGPALLWLGYTLLWFAIIAWLWWRVTYRIVTGEGFVLGAAATTPGERKAAIKPEKVPHSSWSWIPADIRYLVLKELKLKWRSPQSRIGLIYMYLMPVFFAAFPFFVGMYEDGASFTMGRPIMAGSVAVFTIFVFWLNGQNMLGWETTGLPTLLLTPVSRRRLFLAKALAQFLMNGPPMVLLFILAVVLHPSLLSFSLLPTALALGLAIIAIVIPFSVLFPYPAPVEGQSSQGAFSSRGGCLTGLANSVLMPSLIGLVCLPVLVPPALALWQGWDWLALAALILTLPYATILFSFATHFSARLMIGREPEIVLGAIPKEKGK